MKNYLKLRLNKKILVITIFIWSAFSSFAQNDYPQGYFMFPINPGQTNFLSANMGELRSNHFHGGLDVKTDKKIGYPVHASADGYVERVKVSTYGYGNVVYIRHPNNLVTVYAHLDKFNTPIGDYVLKKQYENQTFQVELYPGKNELPIKKGEVIGLAGNSGSSQGPHLHYEIRDTNDVVLNPAKFGFKEFSDNISPSFDKVAITTFNIDSRINNEFGREEFKAVKAGTEFTIPKVNAQGVIGLELKAYDKKNNVYNTFGINEIEVFLDGKQIFKHNINSFTFDETKYINVHLNYPLFSNTGKRFERLYVADGNKLDGYTCGPSKGKIFINDNQLHKVKIKIIDDFNNSSILSFDIQGVSLAPQNIPITSSMPNQGLYSDLYENILKISTKCTGDPGAKLYFKGTASTLIPAYSKAGMVVYLYDLRKGLPDSVKVGSQKEEFHFMKMVPSGQLQKLSFDQINLTIPPDALADTIFLEFQKEMVNGSEAFTIHNKTVPLFDTLTLSISPRYLNSDKSLTNVYSGDGKLLFEGGKWNGDKIEVKTRNFGKFTLAEDTVKPLIKLVSIYANSIQFNIGDNLSGINSFRANLDGYWVLMNYDHKKRLLWSERLDKTVPLKGKFELEVKDNAGNVNNFIINL